MELGAAKAIHQNSVSQECLIKMVNEMVDNDHYGKRLQEINSKEKLDMGLEHTLEVIHGALVG